MTRLIGFLAVIGLALAQPRSPHLMAQAAVASRTMALTFDDLPYATVGAGVELPDTTRVTATLLDVLAAHRAPAVAFVNESKLDVRGETTARIALLQKWVDGGALLGNHTFSHADFNTVTVEQFEEEIVKGDVVTRRLMLSHQPYQMFFRHPETHTGDTAAKKEAIERFLGARGYKIAPHTIDSSDFIFNVGFVRARAVGDQVLATRIVDAYVDFVMSATAFAERISLVMFGRDIPQTILLHANDINAACLDRLLARLEQRGYRFVALESAMADRAYQTRDTYVTKFGPTWLWRWMKSQDMTISFRGDPEPEEWVMDLYRLGMQ